MNARPRSALDRPVALLLSALVSPERVLSLSLDDWDDVVRVGRNARLLGVLRARLERARRLDSIPPPVRAHLDSTWNVAAYRRQMVAPRDARSAKALEPLRIPMILLKGGAYIAQRLACADGRLPEDLDLMVPRERLDEAERALAAAGWVLEKTDPYDEHYYRAWSHELPPHACAGACRRARLAPHDPPAHRTGAPRCTGARRERGPGPRQRIPGAGARGSGASRLCSSLPGLRSRRAAPRPRRHRRPRPRARH